MLSFGEKVGKLEEAVVDILFAGMDYVRVVATYNGELGERAKLIEALRALKGDMPLVLVAYTGGEDTELVRPPYPDGPASYRHDCTIEVVSCADDSRAQYKKTRGGAALTRKGNQALTHRMFSDARDLLSGRQLTAEVDGETVILNEGELAPTENNYVERVTGLTAVSTPFSLFFNYSTPDHSEPYGGEIATINFGLTPATSAPGLNHPPGVFAEIE